MAVIMLVIIVILNLTVTLRLYKKIYDYLDIMAETQEKNLDFSLNESNKKGEDIFSNNQIPYLLNSEVQFFDGTIANLNSVPSESLAIYFYPGLFDYKIVFSQKIVPSDKEIDVIKKIVQHGKSRVRERGIFHKIVQQDDESVLVCITNRIAEIQTLHLFYGISIIVYAFSVAITFLVSLGGARKITKPIQDAFERQKAFIADSSHELRTPISVIDANLDVLLNDYPNNKWLGYIKEENNRMANLVKVLLYLTRNDQNKKRYTFEKIDFSQAVNNVVLPFESVIFEAGKKLDFYVESGMTIIADEEAVKHAITAILDNAVKYSGKNGLIRVRAFCEGSKKVVSVYNTGSAIQPENLKKVFRRFFRENDVRTNFHSGYGLGLSIAHSIAELHDASITADSNGVDWVEFTLKFR